MDGHPSHLAGPAAVAAIIDWLVKFTSSVPKQRITRQGSAPAERNGLYTYADVAAHSTPGDGWIIVDSSVYDVSAWGEKHPGGDVIYSYAGGDATDVFTALHKGAPARLLLRSLRIGTLQPAFSLTTASSTSGPIPECAVPATAPETLGVASASAGSVPMSPASDAGGPTPFVREFRQLRATLEAEGYMRACPKYYTRKCAELLLMLVGAMLLLLSGAAATSSLAWLASATLMANMIHQCGWLTHDFLHNQVFGQRRWNMAVGGVCMNIGMGGCSHWWKTKHNRHHATPNRITDATPGTHHAAVDPDIDTIPLIAWSQELLDGVSASHRALITKQHILLWPLMALAYIQWLQQSWVHALHFPTMPRKERQIELTVMTLRHGALLVAVLSSLPLASAIGYWLAIHAVAGFMTSFVFVQSHNGMEVYSDAKDFATAQLVSTRNINPSPLVDWWCGGLNYQIEHHLFPTMPRHSYAKIQPRVQALCAAHGLPYESVSLSESTRRVYRCLADLAAAASRPTAAKDE